MRLGHKIIQDVVKRNAQKIAVLGRNNRIVYIAFNLIAQLDFVYKHIVAPWGTGTPHDVIVKFDRIAQANELTSIKCNLDDVRSFHARFKQMLLE